MVDASNRSNVDVIDGSNRQIESNADGLIDQITKSHRDADVIDTITTVHDGSRGQRFTSIFRESLSSKKFVHVNRKGFTTRK